MKLSIIIVCVCVLGKICFIEGGGPFIDNRNNPENNQNAIPTGSDGGCSVIPCVLGIPGLLKPSNQNAIACAFNQVKPCCKGDVGGSCTSNDGKRTTGKVVNENLAKRRKRSVYSFVDIVNVHSRVKRQAPQPFWWRCDNAGQKCCKTCRRTLPFVEPFFTKDDVKVWPVYCAKAGGFQLIDQVECRRQRCRKNCRWDWTYYSYLVTTVEPDPVQGHCNMVDAPTFFTRVKIFSHCNCPELRKKKKKKNRGK